MQADAAHKVNCGKGPQGDKRLETKQKRRRRGSERARCYEEEEVNCYVGEKGTTRKKSRRLRCRRTVCKGPGLVMTTLVH
ncbi:Protein CBG27905 [Caenorhabditis briggsae]|uniref:Protein CBG27905 n=1 Tax=Caenorhabditis briggsae TaxID=6238 RepID=B6IEK0_CAEBR|nr:Protein CBG27905 [Caenorhabditis briggsae]CAR98330.1 Protein CBG27905 [Caenorhabditis briggsae]